MKTPNLNTFNFRPSHEKGDWSVVFFYQGSYKERRFDTEILANNFAKYWQELYSQPQWKHRELTEWVHVCLNPLYLRERQNGELEEYK